MKWIASAWAWLRAFAPAAGWAALLIWVGGQTISGPDTGLPLDKVAHLVLYGVLGVLLGRGAARVGAGGLTGALLLCLALAVGAADEVNQRAVPGRFSDQADWAADAIGVLAGYALGRRLGARARRERQPNG